MVRISAGLVIIGRDYKRVRPPKGELTAIEVFYPRLGDLFGIYLIFLAWIRVCGETALLFYHFGIKRNAGPNGHHFTRR